MAIIPAHRAILALAASTIAAVTLVACGTSGTPAAAPTSSSISVVSSASAPASPTSIRPPTSTAAVTPTATTDEAGTTTPSTAAPAPTTGPATDLAGEVYGKVVSVDPEVRQLTLDKYDWFTGEAARQACAEDGVTEHDIGWCTDYYYRNRNPVLRALAVSPDATVTTLVGGSPNEVGSDLASVAQRIAGSESSDLFQITVEDGQVTSIRELYFP